MNNETILSLFDDWNLALQSGEPHKVVALYDRESVLLPTISNEVRHNHAELLDYFFQFLALGPSGKITETNIRIFGDLAINSGVYSFSFNDGSSTDARFTFVYRWTGQHWLIIEHHSSRMPEG